MFIWDLTLYTSQLHLYSSWVNNTCAKSCPFSKVPDKPSVTGQVGVRFKLCITQTYVKKEIFFWYKAMNNCRKTTWHLLHPRTHPGPLWLRFVHYSNKPHQYTLLLHLLRWIYFLQKNRPTGQVLYDEKCSSSCTTVKKYIFMQSSIHGQAMI